MVEMRFTNEKTAARRIRGKLVPQKNNPLANEENRFKGIHVVRPQNRFAGSIAGYNRR